MRLPSLTLLLGSILLSSLAAPAWAGDLSLVSARIGYRGAESGKAVLQHGSVEAKDTWLPCDVVLSNRGDAHFEGLLSLEETTGLSTTHGRRYERGVSLGPHSKKRVQFAVLIQPGRGLRLRFRDQERGIIELAEVDWEGLPVTPGLAIPTPRSARVPLVGIVRGQDSLATQLTDFQGQFTGGYDDAREWLTIEFEGVSALPAEAVLYHRLDLLILDDLDLHALGEDQQGAILSWVAEGGFLWVSTLKASGAGGLLGSALPGQGSGRVVDDRRVLELEPTLGTAPLLGRAREQRVFLPRPRDTPWRAGSEVSVLHSRHGLGWIVRSGFRLTTSRFDKRALLRELLCLRATTRRQWLATRTLLEKLRVPLRRSTLKKMPSRGTVALVVILYAVLGVVFPFLIFRRKGRLELAWVCVVAATAIATGAVLWLGKQTERGSRVVRLSLVEGGTKGPALQTSALAVFSKEGGSLSLEFQRDVQAALSFGTGSKGSREDRSFTKSPRSYVLATNPQDTTLLCTREAVDLPGWVRLTQTGPGAGRVERSEGWELKGAWAFDTDGAPFRELETPSELRTGQRHFDPILRHVLKGAKALAAGRAKMGRPVLLYWWEGPQALNGIPEFGLNLGLVEAEPGFGAWGKVPSFPVQYGTGTIDPQGNARWSFFAALPDPSRRPTLNVLTANRVFQVRDWERGTWVAAEGYGEQELRRARYGNKLPEVGIPNTLRTTPLGVSRGELFIGQGADVNKPSDPVDLRVVGTHQARSNPWSVR
ncbi:MAG: hypothetical protein JKY65_29560 [Planctomycetes bacterium]|nr:hypothetical protein [Planctomycetota bacterium]